MADTTDAVMDLAKRRGFLWPAFEVYGGAAGFYDYGPLGATMKKRFEDLWRHLFLNCAVPMAEVSCPRVTIHDVLKASGHVDEFTDLVVRCKNGHPTRADHLVEAAGFEGTADALSAAEIDAEIRERKPKCTVCKDATWTEAAPMNLMFQTEIGPGSGRVGYLRPETAQGIFTDFPHLHRYFRGKLPFGGIQIGGSNRNEISPRQGMLRLREFHMMEAEVFFRDTQMPFPAFDAIADQEATFVPSIDEKPVRLTFRSAVEGGTVGNEALAYFLSLTQRFLLAAGVDPERLRFRQHLDTEMAHYANDCWDAEFHSDRYGWVECVGIADRGCFDLQQHAIHSGKPIKHPVTGAEGHLLNQDFTPLQDLHEPVSFEAERIVPDMGKLGRTFKGQAKGIIHALEERFLVHARTAGLDAAEWPAGIDAYAFQADTETVPATDAIQVGLDGETVEVPAECFQIEKGTWTVTGAREIPRVIEPSFGVDRILYALWEHAYERGEKNGEPYTVMRLSPHTAPVQAAILPLTNDDAMVDASYRIDDGLRRSGVLTAFDTSGNIGRRYARQDEIGTPVCITVDGQTLEDGTVTLRDRDTTDQVRVQIVEIVPELAKRFQL